MTKNEKLHKLYAELESVMNALKEFVQPHGANQAREWTQQELEKHAYLLNQRNKIWEQIVELESTPD